MSTLKIFILGFLFMYVMQVLDILLQLFSSYISVLITKCNARISDISEGEIEDDECRIGFIYEQLEDEDYYEDYE